MCKHIWMVMESGTRETGSQGRLRHSLAQMGLPPISLPVQRAPNLRCCMVLPLLKGAW
jgi:hypothetical protein